MLHEVDTYACIGKLQGSDFRYAALKAASKGHKRIWIRRTNTKEMREYAGHIIELDTPKEVKRGDRVIKYTRRPGVKFVKKWIFEGPTDNDDKVPITQPPTAEPSADTEQAAAA
jgi:hypothetical protein